MKDCVAGKEPEQQKSTVEEVNIRKNQQLKKSTDRKKINI